MEKEMDEVQTLQKPKTSWLKKALISLVGLAIMLTLLFTTSLEDKSEIPNEQAIAEGVEVLKEDFKQEDFSQYAEAIHQLHEIINQVSGWGHVNTLKQEDIPYAKIEEYSSLLKSYSQHPLLVEDIQAFELRIEEALEQPHNINKDALIQAHRIIHDLDYFLFRYDLEDANLTYYGASKTVENLKEKKAKK